MGRRGEPKYRIFVVDTNSDAGGFEREMCAYITGAIGECEVGEEQAKLAKQEIPEVVRSLDEIINFVADEHGCSRPVDTFPNPRYGNDGHGNVVLLTEKNRKDHSYDAYYSVGIYFVEKPSLDLIKVLKERAQAFSQISEWNFKVEGFRFVERFFRDEEVEI